MASKYDSKTNTFDKEGRLRQVENAMAAINETASALALVTKDGVFLANQKDL